MPTGMAENSQSLRIDKCKAGGTPYTSESGSNPQETADPYGLTDRFPPEGGNSGNEPDFAPSDDDDIEREAIMNESDFDDDEGATWTG